MQTNQIEQPLPLFKCGSIDILNNLDGNFLSKAIRFFTKSQVSHCDFTMGRLMREESVLSAQELMSVLPLKTYIYNPDYVFTIYEIQQVSETELEQMVNSLYVDYAGKLYGFGQLLWFTYRWVAELFHKDVRKQDNWFGKNAICSELVYLLLCKIAKKRFPELEECLQQFNQNTITPADVQKIVEYFPNIFTKKMTCDHGTVTWFYSDTPIKLIA
jgi:hypothetical protein